METVTNQPVQTEVTLRTLASDIQSLEHGSGAPVPESLKISAREPAAESEPEGPSAAPRKTAHTILLIIILIAIAGAGYFYIYPRLIAALAPPTIVH